MSADLDVGAQVALGADEQHWSVWLVGAQLWQPLVSDVTEGGGRDDAETHQEHVAAGVTQRPQGVEVVLHTGRGTVMDMSHTGKGTVMELS